MSVPDRIRRVLGRRQEREELAAIQRAAAQRALRLPDEPRVVLTEGDLICFKVSIRPC